MTPNYFTVWHGRRSQVAGRFKRIIASLILLAGLNYSPDTAFATTDPFTIGIYVGTPPGAWFQECAYAWGTRLGSGGFGPISTVTWTRLSYGGICNADFSVAPASLYDEAIGQTLTYNTLCYRSKWNVFTTNFVAVQAPCSTVAPRSAHTSYFYQSGVLLGGSLANLP